MSIATFVDSSFALLDAGQYDSALALASAAVDATAKKLYGRRLQNNERYKRFLRDKMPIVTRYGMPGIVAGGIRIKCHNIPDLKTDEEGYVGIEDILYHTLRCGLLHQCEIDERIEFIEETYIGDFSEKFRLPHHVVFGLLLAVISEPVNADEASESDVRLVIEGKEYAIQDLWGAQDVLGQT